MIRYNDKDETLVQAGVSISIMIISKEIEGNEAADEKNYLHAAANYNIVTGLKMALNELGSLFGDESKPFKNRMASFMEAVEERLSDIRELEKNQ